jgi:phosphoglycerate kinase
MREYNTIDDFNFVDKTVILRVDFNMPLDKQTLEILDNTRIIRSLDTIRELVNKNAKIVILAHQGRRGDWDFTNMEKHSKSLEKLLGKKVEFVKDLFGKTAQNSIKDMKPGEILVLDNVRKFSGETEKKTPREHAQSRLVQNLYPLADFFINDAFAAAHRAQCSLIGFTAVLPSAAGRLMEKELEILGEIISNPIKPSIFLFGGAKFSDVVVTIKRVLENGTADKIVLTGLPANAFLKANGFNLGRKNEEILEREGSFNIYDDINTIIQKYKNKIFLPIDFAQQKNSRRNEIDISELPTEFFLFDIGNKTINKFKNILSDAKTIFLSGPCGVFEKPEFMKGTKEIFSFVANSDVFSIVGGGHTVAAIQKLGLAKKIGHISTGGGSLEKFMMGEKLPVVEALKSARKIFYN